jgi:LmbE family N-acetylglucosaminyl deacetylase
VIAPHCDDAAFSVGGLLISLGLPQAVTVTTVFTQSNYTIQRQLNNSTEEVTAIRKGEEKSFLASVGVQWIDLNLPEASLRGYKALSDIFVARWADDPIIDAVRNALHAIVTHTTPAIVGLPLGLGHHVDHLIVREVGRVLLTDLKIPFFFFEEIPYATRTSEVEIAKTAISVMPQAIPLRYDISSVLAEKLRLIAGYRSQVRVAEVDATLIHARRLGNGDDQAFERVWLMPSTGTLLQSGTGIED